jgi:SAM-dependent methyltransferase
LLRTDCRAIKTDIYDDDNFTTRVEVSHGSTPDFAAFDYFAPVFREGSILEIGCGTGHLLAAARARGRTVSGTEQSPHHRDYVEQHWGIDVAESIPDGAFDNVLSRNVFEHLVDPYRHLLEVRRVLKPGGRFIVSTANADCLIATLCGPWWAMFKPEDHFSIPSSKSLRIVGERTQLRVGRIWCSEFPLETPFGLALALRDRLQRKNGKAEGVAGTSLPAAARVQRLRELRAFSFVGGALAHLMLANSIKVVFENV